MKLYKDIVSIRIDEGDKAYIRLPVHSSMIVSKSFKNGNDGMSFVTSLLPKDDIAIDPIEGDYSFWIVAAILSEWPSGINPRSFPYGYSINIVHFASDNESMNDLHVHSGHIIIYPKADIRIVKDVVINSRNVSAVSRIFNFEDELASRWVSLLHYLYGSRMKQSIKGKGTTWEEVVRKAIEINENLLYSLAIRSDVVANPYGWLDNAIRKEIQKTDAAL